MNEMGGEQQQHEKKNQPFQLGDENTRRFLSRTLGREMETAPIAGAHNNNKKGRFNTKRFEWKTLPTRLLSLSAVPILLWANSTVTVRSSVRLVRSMLLILYFDELKHTNNVLESCVLHSKICLGYWRRPRNFYENIVWTALDPYKCDYTNARIHEHRRRIHVKTEGGKFIPDHIGARQNDAWRDSWNTQKYKRYAANRKETKPSIHIHDGWWWAHTQAYTLGKYAANTETNTHTKSNASSNMCRWHLVGACMCVAWKMAFSFTMWSAHSIISQPGHSNHFNLCTVR